MRLIDADALYDAGCRWADEHYYFEFDSFEEVVDSAPTIDHVKRGRWIDQLEDDYECSECKSWFGCKYKFCPNCGADMRGNSND